MCFSFSPRHLYLIALSLANSGLRLLDRVVLPLEDQENLEEFCMLAAEASSISGTENYASMRAPLQLALFISPIYLLVSFQLVKKSFNHQTLLDTAVRLGNTKPDILLEVEGIIWRALFSIAKGESGPDEAFRVMIAVLPWEKMDSIGKSDEGRMWFDCSGD